MEMKFSIVIPVFNKCELTRACLDSIFLHGSGYAFEIIVVDNASTDGTREYLDSLDKKVISVYNKDNLGFAKACNQGAHMAKGEYILFLNNDTVVTKNWADVLVEELDGNPKIGIAGSKLLFSDGTIQHAGVVFGDDGLPRHLYRQERSEKSYVNKKRAFQAVTGACLLIRKNIFEEVGGFDEIYKNGMEDVDLCLKVGRKGFSVLYCPESVAYHYESMTEGRNDNVLKNREIFLQRWKNEVEIDESRYLSEDGNLKDHEKMKYAIKQRDEELLDLKRELEMMRTSKFWKMRGFYLKIKNVIIGK